MEVAVPFVPSESADPQHAFQCIQYAIHTRRNDFIAEYQEGRYGSTFSTYEDELDRAVYKKLGEFHESNPDAFQRAKEQLDAYTTFQLQTSIGERLNVGLSTYRFSLRNGELYGQNMEEPLVNMIDRGRQTRNAQVDKLLEEGRISPKVAQQIKERHDAEVTQFTKIQEFMGNPQALPGITMISISPPGPGYVHSFYDVFTLRKHPDGTSYIEARRYASALKPEDSLKQVQRIQADYGDDRAGVALIPYFLAHPVILDDPTHLLFNNPDGIHSFMQGDPNSMTEADFMLIKEVIANIISVYLREVFEDPDNADRHAEILDALKNKADEAANAIKIRHEHAASPVSRRDNLILVDKYGTAEQAYAAALADVSRLGSQPVRVASTGCGESGSSRKRMGGLFGNSIEINMPGNMSPFSLLDDILNQEQEWFTCPKCDYHATGPIGDNGCPNCGLQQDDYDGEKCA